MKLKTFIKDLMEVWDQELKNNPEATIEFWVSETEKLSLLSIYKKQNKNTLCVDVQLD